MYKVSVIIPVYKVSSYIERCFRSLAEQTLDKVEYLFVDDCSPDDSVSIIMRLIEEYGDYFAQHGKNAIILHMPKNSGIAAVRKHGMLHARGEFIIHCDGDDWVDGSLYQLMYEEAERNNADIVMCGSVHEYDGTSICYEVGVLPSSCKEVIRNWYRNTIGLHCWNKMVRQSLYVRHDVYPWDDLNMWEDNGLMARLFYYGGRLSSISGSYYHYNRCNMSAMTVGYGQKQVRQMIGIAHHLTSFFESMPDAAEFEKTIMAFQYLAKINLISDSYHRISQFKKLFPDSEQIEKNLDINAFSKKGRIRFLMVKNHLAWLFVTLFKIQKCFKFRKVKT